MAHAAAIMGCAGDHGSADAQPVETSVATGEKPQIFGGSEDGDPGSSTVALKVGTPGSYELCSGSLIADNIVLTARHCVAHAITNVVSCDEDGHSTNGPHVDGNRDPSTIAVYVDTSPRFNGPGDAVGRTIVSPTSQELCDSDIALVVLDRSLQHVSPLAVRLHAGVAPGETIRSIGYGQNDDQVPMGTRFSKTNVAVLAMGRGVSESQTALGQHEFEVGRSICEGDSGGPAISETTGAILGVVSRGGDCNVDFGHIYTTTNGWEPLFDQAFALAGGAPITETGTPATAPHDETSRTETPPPPAAASSCSAAPRSDNGRTTAPFLALALAAVVVARARRRARAA